MAQKFPTTTAFTPYGPDRANLVSTQKNFQDLFERITSLETKVTVLETKVTVLETKVTALETKVTALETKVTALESALAAAIAALAATASATSSGGGAYVSGSEGNVPVVGGGNSTQYYNADGTPARDGYDFYWEPVPGTTAYNPVFYKDLTVVETVRTKTDGVTPLDRDDRPGAMTTIYNNGHRSIEPIPIEVWNPPVAAWNALPQDQRRAVTDEYATANNIGVMISNPGGDGDSEANNTFTGDAFRTFLESKL